MFLMYICPQNCEKKLRRIPGIIKILIAPNPFIIAIEIPISFSSASNIFEAPAIADDPHIPRFMAYLSLFTFSMLLLVSSDNLVQLFFGWEGVGLCSYLLIGFWYTTPTANAAAIKAFLVNRVGDVGFALGIFAIFVVFGSVQFEEIFAAAPDLVGQSSVFLGMEFNTLTLICLLLFIGVAGSFACLIQWLTH